MTKKITGKLLSLTLALSVILTSLCGSLAISAAPAEYYAAGSGTREDPYLISTVEHLEKLNADTVAGNTAGKYYKLTADLSIVNLTIGQNRDTEALIKAQNGETVPNAVPFKGIFDGGFHTITYTYNIQYGLGGLFSFIDNATVKNLTVDGAAENPSVIFGSVAAIARNSVIENCISKVNVSGGKQMTAGVVAFLEDSALRNVENCGNIVSDVNLSGLSGGDTNSALQNAYSLKITYATASLNVAGVVAMGGGNVTFENVFNTGNVTNNINRDGQYDATHTAGVLATNQSGAAVVMNSVGNTGNITSSDRTKSAADRIGGIYARLEGATFKLNKIWSAGLITPAKKNGNIDKGNTGVIGGSHSGSCTNVGGNVYAYGLQGQIAGYTVTDNKCRTEFFGNPNGFGGQGTIKLYYDGNKYTPADDAAAVTSVDLKSADFADQLGARWQATESGYPVLKTKLFSGGKGVEGDPYIISSVDDLKELDADTVVGNTLGNYYKLTADLTVDNISIGQNRGANDLYVSGTQTLPDAKPFEGTFDGNHHKITYTYNVNYALGGLFTGLKKATVKNLTVMGKAVAPNVIFGSIAAIAQNSVIDNCVSEVEITGARQWTGGIVAIMDGTTITNTENRGNITTDINASAIASANIQTYLSNAYGIANTYLSYEHVITGGIAAVSVGETVFTNVLNTGNVTSKLNAQSEVGGILGINKNPNSNNNLIMTAVGNTGNVTSEISTNRTSDRIGGIYGRLENANYYLNVVWNTGTVKATHNTDSQKGSIGGSVSGACAAHPSVTNETPHKIYAKIGTVIGYSGTGCQAEFLGNGGAIHSTSWIYYYGDAYESINGTYRDMTSDAKFFTDLGDGWRKVDYEYPTLAYHYTIGDFNNDGSFDVLDLVSIKKYTVQANNSSDIVINSCDFDENGDVDATDLASVKKLLLGNELQDVLVSQNTVLRVYSQNVCSHGDSGEAGTADRLTPLANRLAQRNPNIVVLTECSKTWAAYVAAEGSYEVAANTRSGASEIQILYKADEFELVENTVDNSTRSAFHWVVLKSKKTGKKFMVYGYHGDSTDANTRAAEITSMNNTISAKSLPAVVAGDFNSEYSVFSSALSDFTRTAEGSAYDKATWLGWDSTGSTKIDHILYSTNSFDARSYYVLGQKVGDTVISDHCALLAELKLK